MGDLSNAKAGDKVLIVGKWNYKVIKVIDKITPSGLIVVGSSYFYKDGSQRTSDRWNRNRIKLLTEQDEIEIKREHFTISVLRQLQGLKSISYEDALKFNAIINRKE